MLYLYKKKSTLIYLFLIALLLKNILFINNYIIKKS